MNKHSRRLARRDAILARAQSEVNPIGHSIAVVNGATDLVVDAIDRVAPKVTGELAEHVRGLAMTLIRTTMAPKIKASVSSAIEEMVARQVDGLGADIEARVVAEVAAQWQGAVDRAVRDSLEVAITAVKRKMLGP